MAARYVNVNGVAVELGGGGGAASALDQWPPPPLSDTVDSATSSRDTDFTLTGSATPFNPGAWVEIDPSISANASGIAARIHSTSVNTGNGSMFVDIGTGAAAAESVLATVAVGNRAGADGLLTCVPCSIPAGTRIAMRVRSAATASKTAIVDLVHLISERSGLVPGTPVMIGQTDANARGVTLTTPGAINTKGAWTQIIASTAADYDVLVVMPQMAGNTSTATGTALIDIGIGAGGSETVIIPDLFANLFSSESMAIRSPMTWGIHIPAGTRIAARCALTNLTNTIDISLIAVPST